MASKIRVESSGEDREALTKKLEERRERLRQEIEIKREADIEKSLAEIYRDSDGKKIDVNRMKINRRQGFIFWFFNFLIVGLIVIVIGLGFYYYLIYGKNTSSNSLTLEISGPEFITAGEEFTYIVKYKNPEYVALKNVSLNLQYSDNFIFLSSEPKPGKDNNNWNIGRINARSEGEISIKGRVIDETKSSSVILAQLIYMPENFSSEFKKETSASLIIRDTGFEAAFDYSSTALVNEQGEIKLRFKPLEKNYFPNFIIRLETSKNFEIKNTIISDRKPGDKTINSTFKIESVKEADKNIWLVSRLEKEESFEIIYKIKEKLSDKEEVKIYLEESVGGKEYVFLEKNISLEVMKSDLNLNIIMNGSQTDKPVNFGDILNYSIVYSNKGEVAMKDVIITAFLDSDFINWASLKDANKGREKGNTITWTSEEVSNLREIGVNKGGSMDFSVDVLSFSENDLAKKFQIKAFARYDIGSLGEEDSSSSVQINNQDSRSNIIVSVLNSDLNFKEEVRYFDENNLPVGSGPLPPRVEEKTSFKAYWSINNNLHDLNELKIETILPEGVVWEDRNRTSVGTLIYNEEERKITWQIGRLPITVFRADAEFNISLTPKEENKNKIVVLLVNTKTTAIDSKTEAIIEKNGGAKTTKLEDDEIANMSSDGIIR